MKFENFNYNMYYCIYIILWIIYIYIFIIYTDIYLQGKFNLYLVAVRTVYILGDRIKPNKYTVTTFKHVGGGPDREAPEVIYEIPIRIFKSNYRIYK